MQSVIQTVTDRVYTLLASMVETTQLPTPLVVPAQNPQFGDYQCNAAMGLSRSLRKSPRAIAEQIVAELEIGDLCEPLEIAGPGFINFRLRHNVVAEALSAIAADSRLGLAADPQAQTVIIDFSGPNLAKEMHVGHLRSTIIGDCLARFLQFQGHTVLRMNHVGDWGTQFGMLLHYLRTTQPQAIANADSFSIDDLEGFYRDAKKAFDADNEFADAARRTVVQLQSGDPQTLAIWEVFCRESLRHCHAIYKRLQIPINDRGESAYNADLPPLVAELRQAGLGKYSEGAVCVFIEPYETPLIVEKSDGGYKYETTDLAAIRYRVGTQHADHIIYVTDARQAEHFAKVFATAEAMQWAPPGMLEHIGFGMMLGNDGKPFKTRTGGTVKLKDLLQEAEDRAASVAAELDPTLDADELALVARVVGHGTVKYADLVHALNTDYKFDWDKMLALDGNTAVYLLYSYARTRSLGRKGNLELLDMLSNARFVFADDSELRLAKLLLRTLDLWPQVVRERAPHLLLAHLYAIAQAFSNMWNCCPIYSADPQLRDSRLALAALVGKTLKWGLAMVGIPTLERI